MGQHPSKTIRSKQEENNKGGKEQIDDDKTADDDGGGTTSADHHKAAISGSSSRNTSFLAKLSGAGQKQQRRKHIESGGTQQPLTHGATTTMNARFPVESGESLSRATTAPAHQPVPIAQRNGSSVLNDQTAADDALPSQQLPVWVYVIFRRNPSTGHDKVNVKDSLDGPVFWTRRVLYVFCCSCHFDRHEHELLKLLEQNKNRVERVCLVDRPLDYPFLPDSLFGFMANNLARLEFVYLRELDLEKINRATVERLSEHRHLRKLIVHGCRNYEALQDFRNLPQLLVVKGSIQGLKAMLGCEEDPTVSSIMDESSSSSSSENNLLSNDNGQNAGKIHGTHEEMLLAQDGI